MKLSDKRKREKYLKLRYRRELERYFNSLVSFVMGDFKKSEFDRAVKKAYKRLDEIEKVKLYSEYFEKLEKFVKRSNELLNSSLTAEEIKKEIVYSANQIRKNKRKREYSRKKIYKNGYELYD